MASILQSLKTEWSTFADSRSARHALARWSAEYPALLPAADLDDVLALGYQRDAGPEIGRALATLAASDSLAARTLLQALLGGLVNLARRVGRDDDALDDIIALAWERIRTYPAHRPGSVSGNVVLDVHKRYCRDQERAGRDRRCVDPVMLERSTEDHVLGNAFLDDLLAAGGRAGVSEVVLGTIIRSRIGG